MKIAIIADTHDNTPAIVWIIEYLNKHSIKTALHAGDIINPGIIRRFRDHYNGHLHFVFGNNDGEKSGLTLLAEQADNLTCHNRDMIETIADKKIYMNHYSENAIAQATTEKYDICIGGHDHLYRTQSYGKTLFINPGNTVTKDKWLPQQHEKQSSFVVLDLDTVTPKKITIDSI